MNESGGQKDTGYLRKTTDRFLLALAVIAIVAISILLYLLNIRDLGLGNLVVLAGLGGIVGASLSPLLEQRPEKEHSETTQLAMTPSHIATRLLVHVAGGFGAAAAAFVVTSALLLEEPGNATSALGTAAFGGGVGYFIGRDITRISLRWARDETGQSPAVVAALGQFEDQLFGRPLLNYDGYAVATWHASRTYSMAVGKLSVYLEPRKVREERKDVVENTRPEFETETTQPLSLQQEARVLLQGGKDADSVPFAISVISGAFDVQPHRLILAAPSGDKSEELDFTLLDTQRDETDAPPNGPTWSVDSEPNTATVLIDVSQEGQTVQLFEMKVSSS